MLIPKKKKSFLLIFMCFQIDVSDSCVTQIFLHSCVAQILTEHVHDARFCDLEHVADTLTLPYVTDGSNNMGIMGAGFYRLSDDRGGCCQLGRGEEGNSSNRAELGTACLALEDAKNKKIEN